MKFIQTIISATWLMFISANVTAGSDAYVGAIDDSSCTHNSIQSAIDDASQFNRIYVAAGYENNRIVYNENLNITRSIVFFGGYDTCSDAISGNIYIDSPMVYLEGTGNGPVVKLSNAGNVDLYRFEISGGHGSTGGGVESNDTKTRLINSFVHSNTSNSQGGGIYSNNTSLNSMSYQLELRNTIVIFNQALLGGGGIYANNTNILADERVGVSYNQVQHSSGDGGGMFLYNSNLDFYGGTNDTPYPGDISTYQGIGFNSTPRNGGGIYAYASSISLLGAHYFVGNNNQFGWAGSPLNVNNNTADSDLDNNGNGGGIYITGGFLAPSFIEIHRGKVTHNYAHQGGAFYVGENSSLSMIRTRAQGLVQGDGDCWDEKCSQITHNKASFKGGVAFVENGANVTISQSYLTDNRSDYGTVLYADSTDSTNNIRFHQNMIYHNGRDGDGDFEDYYTFGLYNNSEIVSSNELNVELIHNTVVDNHATQAVFTVNGVKNYLGVFSSILHDPSSPQIANLFGSFNTAEFDCVNANETVSISGGYSTLSRDNADDPGFIIRNYDYHLKPRAATVDFCDNSRIGNISITNDIDDDTRAVNDVGYPDFYGAWDLGADENTTQFQTPLDVIFIDGFDW